MKSLHSYLFVVVLAAARVFAQSTPAPADSKPATQPATQPAPHKADRAAAYYHYSLAHMYEEQVAVYGRSDLASKAIEEYRAAIRSEEHTSELQSQ